MTAGRTRIDEARRWVSRAGAISNPSASRARIDELDARLVERWDAIRTRIARVTLGATRMTAVLEAAGAPSRPADLGWSAPLFAQALEHAREIRNRYTFLDFAADTRV